MCTIHILTFTARASYRLGRHLNISALPQAQTSHTLGQPQPQPFKYFALNIFREISLILSTTLEVFPAICLTDILVERKPHVSIFYMRLFVHSKFVVATMYSLFFLAPFGWLVNDLLYCLEYVTTHHLGYSDMVTGYHKQKYRMAPYIFFLTLLAELETQC